ncbi:ATP-grasp domain-containing protein [Kitasatospora camelliae]|uniref:ATP-grasp domain-containing protein n=1 Tax=Kitasatospora camelliae TaxID=3156397 RepID=A0AAU8K098_9ACTN
MILVVIGANENVARAAASLGTELVHVQLPGAPEIDPGGGRILRVDFRDPAVFLPFVDEVLAPLAPTAVVSLTEPGLEPAAAANARLGTPGPSPAVVRATRDKLTMRRILEERAPHLNPAFAPGDDEAAVERLFATHAQVVAKPVDGVGSSAVDLVYALGDLPKDRRTSATLLEQFVGGREFSIECLSSGGRHTIMGIAEKGVTATGFIELSHLMPPLSLDERRRALVEEAVRELLDALGLTDGPSHTEVKVDGDKVTVIETHNRLGGDGIADLVRLTTGVDWRRAAVGWAVGAGAEPEAPAAACAATVFFTAQPGRVTAVAPQPELAHGTVVDWSMTVDVGDLVNPLRSSVDRLGVATLTAADPRRCAAAITELTANRIVTTEPVPTLR